jgi:hypothetical protein
MYSGVWQGESPFITRVTRKLPLRRAPSVTAIVASTTPAPAVGRRQAPEQAGPRHRRRRVPAAAPLRARAGRWHRGYLQRPQRLPRHRLRMRRRPIVVPVLLLWRQPQVLLRLPRRQAPGVR